MNYSECESCEIKAREIRRLHSVCREYSDEIKELNETIDSLKNKKNNYKECWLGLILTIDSMKEEYKNMVNEVHYLLSDIMTDIEKNNGSLSTTRIKKIKDKHWKYCGLFDEIHG